MAGLLRPYLCLLVLLTALCFPAAVHASFIEAFTKKPSPASSTTAGNHLSHLWQQLAMIEQGGRGPDNQGLSMLIRKQIPIAETVLLQWDKTFPAELVFYASRVDSEPGCAGSFKLLYSTDGISWSELWGEDLLEWTPIGYEPVRVTLPLAEGDTKFALKWTYTQEKDRYFSCYDVRLDDMTFPAQATAKAEADKTITSCKPAKPVQQPRMPAGVAPIPRPLFFQTTCTWAATYCGMAVGGANNATNTTVKVNDTTAAGNATARANITASTANNNTASAASVVKNPPASPAPKPASATPTAAAVNAVNDDTAEDAEPAAGDAEGTAAVSRAQKPLKPLTLADEEPSVCPRVPLKRRLCLQKRLILLNKRGLAQTPKSLLQTMQVRTLPLTVRKRLPAMCQPPMLLHPTLLRGMRRAGSSSLWCRLPPNRACNTATAGRATLQICLGALVMLSYGLFLGTADDCYTLCVFGVSAVSNVSACHTCWQHLLVS